MKKTLLSLVLCSGLAAGAQVGIGTTTPNTSAQLEVNSTAKGVLFPRLTAAQRTGIATPATGLLVYQTDAPAGFYYNAGTPAAPNWVLVTAANDANVTRQGNSFNGASQLVQLNASTQLPAVSGANVTALNAANLSSGTVNTARLGSGTANNTSFLRGDGTWAAPAAGTVATVTATGPITLSTANQFVFITGGAHTITLPAAPLTGQIIYLYTDNTGAQINPNGKVFRQANADWGTSTFTNFGTNSTQALTLIYNGSKWFPYVN